MRVRVYVKHVRKSAVTIKMARSESEWYVGACTRMIVGASRKDQESQRRHGMAHVKQNNSQDRVPLEEGAVDCVCESHL